MKNPRTAGILFLFAGALFVISALLEGERSTLRFAAGAVLGLAGVVWLVRSRSR